MLGTSGTNMLRALRVAVALAAGAAASAGAGADEIKVMAAGAFKPVIAAMAPGFEKRTGHKVRIADDNASALAARIRKGEDFDLAVLPPDALESLAGDGLVSGGSITPLARSLQPPAVYAGAVSAAAADSSAALSLLILLASEDTQSVLKGKGLAAP